MIKKSFLFLIILTCIGGIFRFYNLEWGTPFYFHPDERNIASSIAQFIFPTQLNPHFFAYGSFPLYVMYGTGLLQNLFTNMQIPFMQAIVVSRIYAALLSTTMIPLLFFLGKKIKNTATGIIAALLSSVSVGFIQFAHFGTFEIWLAFLSLLLFYLCVEIVKRKSVPAVIFSAIVMGILIGTKVSSVVLLPIPIVCILWSPSKKIKECIKNIVIFLFFTVFVYAITNPFVFLDTQSFLGSMHYESSVALGSLPVFYTGEFFTTIPVLFQFLHVYPFLLNPFITMFFLPSFFFVTYSGVKKRNFFYLLLAAFYLILFLSQAFFFAKWTRYMLVTLPFIYVCIAIFLSDMLEISKKNGKHGNYWYTNIFVYSFLLLVCTFYAISYFTTAFVEPDTRTKAEEFAKKTIPFSARIITEPYDLGILPFNSTFSKIDIVNLYDLENNKTAQQDLGGKLLSAEYIILPSQRIMKMRLLHAKEFPDGNAFYTALFIGHLGFKKIYETPCDTFCKITYLKDPVFSFEETANVFERPTVYIFKKM